MKFQQLNQNNVALLVIDIQERLLKIMQPEITESVVRQVGLMIDMCHHLNIPILPTVQYVKGLGPTYGPILTKLGGRQPLEKMSFSCTADAAIHATIQKLDKKFILLTGMETHVCVLQTALGLLVSGYVPIVLADAVQSSTKLKWQTALDLMRQEGVLIANSETVLFQIVKQSGNNEFKHLIGLLKALSA